MSSKETYISDPSQSQHREVTDLKEQLEARSRSEDQTLVLTKLVFNVSIALATQGALKTMLKACCETLVQELGAGFARIWTLRPGDSVLQLQASAGLYTHLNGPHSRVSLGEFKIGRIASSRKPHLTNDVTNDSEISNPEWAKREGMVSFAGHPLLISDKVVGVLAVFSRSPFDESTLNVLATIASLIAHCVDREWLREITDTALIAAERSNEALQRFAAIASHDLQEPLRQVTAFSQMLTEFHKHQLDADAQEYLSFIVDGASRMARLIQGLLAYAQIDAIKSIPLDRADLEISLADSLMSLDLLVRETRAIVTHDPLPTVTGNQDQLTQLFQNLIGNSLKYRSTADPRVHISALGSESEWVISVSDNGLGIEQQNRHKIFGVFTRLHGNDISGTGLGLAFCSKIIELHRGKIWADDNLSEDGGSVFRFTIPI